MSEKKYKLINDMEFSIYMFLTLKYLNYTERYNPLHDLSEYFHMSVTMYYDEYSSTTSIYIPISEITAKEIREIRRAKKLKKEYEPSEEFIHIVRSTILITKKNWIKTIHAQINYRRGQSRDQMNYEAYRKKTLTEQKIKHGLK